MFAKLLPQHGLTMAPWLEPSAEPSLSQWGEVAVGSAGSVPLGADTGAEGRPQHLPSATAATPVNVHLRQLQDSILGNCTAFLQGAGIDSDSKRHHQQQEEEAGGNRDQLALDEFQIIKAVVLALVTSIILLSICKMVFQLFVRYAAKADDR